MAKREADDLKKIEVWWLKKYGYFEGWKTGGINWPRYESSIGIEVKIVGKQPYLRITYSQTDSRGKKDFDYKVEFVTTRCNYGGFRYWFRCPLITNGRFCGRRVGVLYKAGDYFGCRHCQNLTYESRNLSGVWKIGGKIVSLGELEHLQAQVKRKFYNKNLTKKMQRYMMKRRKSESGLMAKLGILDARPSKEDDLTEEDFKDLI